MAFIDVIKYEGSGDIMVWKYPRSDFNTKSQLIVGESQEAVFVKDGQVLDIFPAGRFTLKTDNLPLLRHVVNLPSGGKNPFTCDVYFVNKTHQMAVKWGTDSQVQFMEPTYHFPLRIGACGEMILSVQDAKRLLVKMVGVNDSLTQQQLVNNFHAVLMSKVKSYIAGAMQTASYTIFEVDSYMDQFSNQLHQMLMPDFADYGVTLERFFVTNIAKPEGDSAYERFKNIHIGQYANITEAKLQQQSDLIFAQTEAQKTVIESQSMAAKRTQEGYTYQQEHSFQVAQTVAGNDAVAPYANMGMGLGAMMGVGASMAGMVGGMVQQATDTAAQPAVDSMTQFKIKLEKLMLMKEMGAITEEEFLQAKLQMMKTL